MSNRIVQMPPVESFGRLTPDKWLALKNLEESEVNPDGEWEGLSIEPTAKRFTEALIRDGGRFKYIPLFGWCVCIVRDYKTKPKETTNE